MSVFTDVTAYCPARITRVFRYFVAGPDGFLNFPEASLEKLGDQLLIQWFGTSDFEPVTLGALRHLLDITANVTDRAMMPKSDNCGLDEDHIIIFRNGELV